VHAAPQRRQAADPAKHDMIRVALQFTSQYPAMT